VSLPPLILLNSGKVVVATWPVDSEANAAKWGLRLMR
jgi:hypothetical protein